MLASTSHTRHAHAAPAGATGLVERTSERAPGGAGLPDSAPATGAEFGAPHGAAHRPDATREGSVRTLVGGSSAALEVIALIERVAITDTTVLIRGESGVGKELVAREIHHLSARSRQPLIVVDCASLHDNLLQSELFGHERGAYTGAIRLKHGLFELANRGTIFLDEIGELTPELQVKLLRVLESGTFRRLGGTVDLEVDVRVIAATNRPLELLMKDGRFREDLFYRLNVFPVDVPPLRERTGDIPALAEHFVRHSALSAKRATRIGTAAMELMLRYPWPGNVRELENAIERALILCDDGVIETSHLPVHPELTGSISHALTAGRLATLEEVGLRLVAQVLQHCDGHRRRAAAILGISERSLYRMLKRAPGGGLD
jgi:Nif-specific regulatory protein